MEYWRRKKEKKKAKKKEKKKKKEEEKKEKDKASKCFLKNGSMFLEQLITDCNGMSNPIRMFSSDQISKATNHFDLKCSPPELAYPYICFIFYKGVIDGRSYLIKRFTMKPWFGGEEEEERAYNDIVLSVRVSNHIGFLKLLGCCLEFPLPVLVFEDLEYRALNRRGSLGSKDAPVLPWNVRLKIAKEIANAITYLHTAFPRIIIHRNISSGNVFVDKNWKAKLTDFSCAVTLPEGKTWIEDKSVFGTFGYRDPIYEWMFILTEYSDVYSFGILMLVLLLGREAYMGGVTMILKHVKDLLERGESVEFAGDSNDMRPGQMKMFLELALKCCEERNEDRPKMISVAKQIKLIEQASLSEDGQI